MVRRVRLRWIDNDGSGEMKVLNVIVPPVAVLGTKSAGALLDCIHWSKFGARLDRHRNFMHKRAVLGGKCRELDAASNNKKYCAHADEKIVPETMLSATLDCGLHQNNHGLGALCVVIGLQLITATCSMSIIFCDWYWRL